MIDLDLDGADSAWRTAAVRELLRSATDFNDLLPRIARVAAEALGVPVSVVSLTDEGRQVFVGHHGLGGDWREAGALPLSHAICRHVVTGDRAIAVTDLRRDDELGGSLAVRDLEVISYAGVPLRMSNGHTIGSFCAIDHRPRRWTEEEIRLLDDLAVIARDLLELRLSRTTRFGEDQLTGLATREVFERLVTQALAATRPVAILAFGLDDFRAVNETLGHSLGDELLIAVAARLTDNVRAGDSVCRLAGDQFLVLAESVSSEVDAQGNADRLRHLLSDFPYSLGGRDQDARVSTGVATIYDGADAEGLIDVACEALRHAKDHDLRRVSATPSGATRARLRLRREITGAHERDELHLVYQPVVDIRTGAVRAIEALMRWTHPELGAVSPATFIPAAETSGAIVSLGEWAIQQACADLVTWRAIPGQEKLVVGVNVAPVQLSVPTLPQIVELALSANSLPGRALGIEITERTLLGDSETSRTVLRRLSDIGLTLAVDDFGTGYSALGYLTKFAVDVVKIDRSFIAAMDTDTRSRSLVTGILGLASGLDMQTIAEGVETQQQHDALKTFGFTWAQGFHYARPMRAAEVAATLTEASA